MALNKLWVEAHRPNTIDSVVFANDRERNIFNLLVSSGEIPNLLLLGHQGTGKTSISQALVKDLKLDRSDVMKINCSDEQIETIRDKVKSFAYTMPMGKFKVVRLEEMDYLSQPAQALLRVLIEEVESSCRFIATANYSNKILPAMRSRFQEHVISAPNRDEVLIRAAEILTAESIEFEIVDLETVVAVAYPDMRKIIQILEANSKTGKLLLGSNDSIADWKLQLLPLLEAGDLKNARKLVCESATREELVDVYRFLFDNLNRISALKGKEDQAVVIIAQYQYQHAFVADVEIQIAALFIELGLIR